MTLFAHRACVTRELEQERESMVTTSDSRKVEFDISIRDRDRGLNIYFILIVDALPPAYQCNAISQ